MAVSTTQNRNDYNVDGVSKGPFTYEFLVQQESDLQVYENGVLTAKPYTVIGIGEPQGGEVTFTEDPPAAGLLSLIRRVPLTQSTDYRPYDAFPAERVESDFDRSVLIDQQQQEEIDRAIQFPPDEAGFDQYLPSAAARAGKLFGWDGGGATIPVEGSDQSATAVTPVNRTTSRTLALQATLAGQWVDVSDPDYGAVGNGSVDDTAAIQAAINAAGFNGIVYLGDAKKTYLCGNLTIVNGVRFAGQGKIKGQAPTGTRPTREDLTNAADAAARTALLTGYYNTTLVWSGGGFELQGTVTFEDVLISGVNRQDLRTKNANVTLTNCACDNSAFTISDNSVLNAPALIATNGKEGEIVFDVDHGGVVRAKGAIITNCWRAARIIEGGSVDLENAEIWNCTSTGITILYSGAVNVKNAVIDNVSGTGLLNNYGGNFNAENVTIRNISGTGIAVESEGSCFAFGATIDNCSTAVAVAIGGMVNIVNGTITNTQSVCLQTTSDGFIYANNVTIDASNANSVLVQATGSGNIWIGEPGVASGLTTVPASAFQPRWNNVGRGNAFIGDYSGRSAGTGGFVTFSANDATPSISGGRNFKTANTGATTITNFDGGKDGQEIKVVIGDANTTIDFTGTNLKGNAGANWSPAANDHMSCIYDGTTWFCDISKNV